MSSTEDRLTPSTASAPDLDWSQVRETIQMLHLAVAQIELAMREGDDSVNELASSFTAMVGEIKAISTIARSCQDADSPQELPADRIVQRCDGVSSQMSSAVVAFQFYDKLSQRLQHVGDALSRLSTLVVDPAKLYNPEQWRLLQREIRARYTTLEEQEIFDVLHRGGSVDDALVRLQEIRAQADEQEDDDILF